MLRERRVGFACQAAGSSRSGSRGAPLAAPGLGEHAQGRNRPLEPTDGCQHDARGEGMDPGLPASPVAAGVG